MTYSHNDFHAGDHGISGSEQMVSDVLPTSINQPPTQLETFDDVSSSEVTRRLFELASLASGTLPTPSMPASSPSVETVNQLPATISPATPVAGITNSAFAHGLPAHSQLAIPDAVNRLSDVPSKVSSLPPAPTYDQATEPDLSKLPTASQSSLPAPVLAALLRASAATAGPSTPAAQAKAAVDKFRQPQNLVSTQKLVSDNKQSDISQFQDSHRVASSALETSAKPHFIPSFGGHEGQSFAPKPYKSAGYRPVDIDSIRSDFPALHQNINGHPLVWFDNAATTHKPNAVIDAMSSFYRKEYSNIHRAAHALAARATDHYEAARETVQRFIHADSSKDIVFVRGTTEGMNFLANVCEPFLKDGDEILLSELEHHANIVPWQMMARRANAKIRVIPFDDNGEILLDEYRRLLTPRTKIVSVSHASNTLGTVLPVEDMAAMAHKRGARFIVDGAQSIAHMPINVSEIGCDFFVFSGHKIFAPTGIGAVYVHPDLQDLLPPWQGGGNMIQRVTFQETTYSDAPAKFEAGTPSIGDAVGLGAALEYLEQFDPHELINYEHSLLEQAQQGLSRIKGVTIYGKAKEKVGLVSFTLDRYTTDAVGKELNRHGIAVRTGHHCAQPSLRHFGLESTVRPSFALYNTHEEIDRMLSIIHHLARKV